MAHTAENQDFDIYQGDDNIPVQFTVIDDQGTPVDVSAAQFVWAFAKTLRAVPIVQKTELDDINLSDPVNGVIQIVMRAADTETRRGAFQHELVITLDGQILTIATGVMTIKDSSIK
jgi:hypothetical protein